MEDIMGEPLRPLGPEDFKRAFLAGWWMNAATPDVGGCCDQEYFDGCAEADWKEWLKAQAASEGLPSPSSQEAKRG